MLELVVVSKPVALAFCGRLLLQQPTEVAYFDPANDWPQPIELNATFPIVLEQLAFLGDTRSRCELLVFAQANPARLPLTMGILQPNIPVRRMMSERRTKLTDALCVYCVASSPRLVWFYPESMTAICEIAFSCLQGTEMDMSSR